MIGSGVLSGPLAYEACEPRPVVSASRGSLHL